MGSNSATSTPADRRFGDVRLNRRHGIFQLTDRDTFRTVFVIEESADKARRVAHDNRMKRWQEHDFDNETWLSAAVTVDLIGLAEKTQLLGILARAGDWDKNPPVA